MTQNTNLMQLTDKINQVIREYDEKEKALGESPDTLSKYLLLKGMIEEKRKLLQQYINQMQEVLT